jgi:hypothetical protein
MTIRCIEEFKVEFEKLKKKNSYSTIEKDTISEGYTPNSYYIIFKEDVEVLPSGIHSANHVIFFVHCSCLWNFAQRQLVLLNKYLLKVRISQE